MSNKKCAPKIIILTLPLRDTPTDFPPLGSLSVITALKKAGFENTHFYNLDFLRPKYEEVLTYLEKEKPDILGVSAVVSTGYGYTKKLSLDIKKLLPDVTILLGGNLGASAEILLKKTGVDFICSGEGDKTAVDFVHCWLKAKSKSSFNAVNGLAYLSDQRELVMTPYAKNISAAEVYDIDWSILEDIDQMDFYIQQRSSSRFKSSSFAQDPRSNEPHRKNKTIFFVVTSKGCVAKCSFCHRWDTGIRYIPVPVVMKRIDYFIEKYDVGFISFGDENFGSDKKWLSEFLREIKTRNLLWAVSGMRARSTSFELLSEMKDAGCCEAQFGLESGSQRMLDVMDKVTSIEHNYNAIKWTTENKLATCLQFVIGMPGETPESIQETADFACYYAELSPEIDPNHAAINFAQALPGTPLYELARRKGLIGPSIDDEENYLLKVSNRDARDGETNINFTDYPKLLLENWHFEIQIKTRNAYVKKWGKESYNNLILKKFEHHPQLEGKIQSLKSNFDSDSGYFAYPARAKEKLKGMADRSPSIWWLIRQKVPGLIPMRYPSFFWWTRHFSILFVLPWAAQKYGIKITVAMCIEYLKWKANQLFSFAKIKTAFEPISLRKTILKNIIPPIPTDNPAMEKFRKGR
jgi:anaerobic magnesium-protoporphyrin IX monomethyl ester cyclase